MHLSQIVGLPQRALKRALKSLGCSQIVRVLSNALSNVLSNALSNRWARALKSLGSLRRAPKRALKRALKSLGSWSQIVRVQKYTNNFKFPNGTSIFLSKHQRIMLSQQDSRMLCNDFGKKRKQMLDGGPGLIAQFSKCDFWNLGDFLNRNMWSKFFSSIFFHRKFFGEKIDFTKYFLFYATANSIVRLDFIGF